MYYEYSHDIMLDMSRQMRRSDPMTEKPGSGMDREARFTSPFPFQSRSMMMIMIQYISILVCMPFKFLSSIQLCLPLPLSRAVFLPTLDDSLQPCVHPPPHPSLSVPFPEFSLQILPNRLQGLFIITRRSGERK